MNWYFELRTSITFPNIRPFFANQPIFSSRSRAVWSSSSSSSSSAAVPCVCPSSCRCPHRPVWTSTSASVDRSLQQSPTSRLRDAGFVCCQVIKGRTELTYWRRSPPCLPSRCPPCKCDPCEDTLIITIIISETWIRWCCSAVMSSWCKRLMLITWSQDSDWSI